MGDVNREKISATQALLLISEQYQQTSQPLIRFDEGKKRSSIDNSIITGMENRVKLLMLEIENLRQAQSQDLRDVRHEMKESLESAMLSAHENDPNTSAAVIATGQCLSCGRLASIHGEELAAHIYRIVALYLFLG